MIDFDPVKFIGFVAGTSLLASLVLLSGPASSQEISSGYSKISQANCMTLIVNEDENWSQQVCKGVDGVAVFVSEGDLRMSITYRRQDAGARYFTFPNFNRVGDVMEWRLRDNDGYRKPFATILRWYVELDMGVEKQALVVTKLEKQDFCIAGFVEATENSNANELARRIADEVAPTFVCGRDKPGWFGKTGPLSQTVRP